MPASQLVSQARAEQHKSKNLRERMLGFREPDWTKRGVADAQIGHSGAPRKHMPSGRDELISAVPRPHAIGSPTTFRDRQSAGPDDLHRYPGRHDRVAAAPSSARHDRPRAPAKIDAQGHVRPGSDDRHRGYESESRQGRNRTRPGYRPAARAVRQCRVAHLADELE